MSVKMENPKLVELRRKFAEKPWIETFQLVRRCMDIPRDRSKVCVPLFQAQKRLQEQLNASFSAIKSRLELIAKQLRTGFHATELTCYLTADLFYLEVTLLPNGYVKDVIVAPHGKSPVPSESLLQLLRTENFADFTIKSAELFAQYNIPGDNEMKMKLLSSLRHLVEDLEQISHLPQSVKYQDPEMEMINNGRIGNFTAKSEDCPYTIQFYKPRCDEVKTTESTVTNPEANIQTAKVCISPTNKKHKLLMAPVLLQPPQLDPKGFPVFLSLNDVPREAFPAEFQLKLRPALPLKSFFVKLLFQMAHVDVADFVLQWAPFRKLLMLGALGENGEKLNEKDEVFLVSHPQGVVHRCIFPKVYWDTPQQAGILLDSVPFTHPVQVVALLTALRHQCAINTLLRSCFPFQPASPGSVCGLHFEVLPESDTSFSVTFPRPNTDSLAVLLVKVSDPYQITCCLYGAGTDPSLNDYIATVMQSCMSIPKTIWALHAKLQQITSAPLSVSQAVATDAENEL